MLIWVPSVLASYQNNGCTSFIFVSPFRFHRTQISYPSPMLNRADDFISISFTALGIPQERRKIKSLSRNSTNVFILLYNNSPYRTGRPTRTLQYSINLIETSVELSPQPDTKTQVLASDSNDIVLVSNLPPRSLGRIFQKLDLGLQSRHIISIGFLEPRYARVRLLELFEKIVTFFFELLVRFVGPFIGWWVALPSLHSKSVGYWPPDHNSRTPASKLLATLIMLFCSNGDSP